MKVLIREGSAAKNLDSLKNLFNLFPGMIMLCSDDLHPEMLVERHINKLLGRLITEGFDLFDVIRSATVNPVIHYKLDAGLLRKGEIADFIIVRDLKKMDIEETWIGGKKVFSNGIRHFSYEQGKILNNFRCNEIELKDIIVKRSEGQLRIIEAYDGELLTGEIRIDATGDYFVNADVGNDILKIVVKDRYKDSPPAIGFIKGFGLMEGAFASSIAHDSHNIVSVGTNDRDIAMAINEIIKMKGGLSISVSSNTDSLQLNIGGIMTTRSCSDVACEYSRLNEMVRSLGCTMTAPFMTLSFMALLVIPDLKIGDRGLFDVRQFTTVPLFVEHAG
jgi:adenine deaminase